MAARDFGPWTYTSDASVDYVRRADKFITSQLDGSSNPKVGGSSAAALTPYEPFPQNFRPRQWYVSGSGGYKARVVVYDIATYTAGLADGRSIDVRDGGGTTHACTVSSGIGERAGRKIGRSQ